MNDLTDLIERATADQPPLSITRQSAVAAGRRALRRRRQGTAVLGIAAVAAVAAGVTAVPHFRGTGTPIGGPSPVLDTFDVPQLPVAAGVPGALDQPSLVGTDRQLVHFSVPTSRWPVGEASYETDTGRGAETISAGGLTVTVSRSRNPAEDTANSVSRVSVTQAGSSSPIPPQTASTPTTVDGRPATLYSAVFPSGRYPYFGVLWQPADGLWVGVFAATASGVAELWADVAALDLHHAGRIVAPFQLAWAPPNVHLLGLHVGIPATGQPYAFSSANWGDDRGNTVTVSIGEIARPLALNSSPGSSPEPLEPNRTVAGHPLLWYPDQCPAQPACGNFISDDYDGVPLELSVSGYDEATATQILTGLHISKNLKDPSTWYTDLIVH